jgi:hypothetical protein
MNDKIEVESGTVTTAIIACQLCETKYRIVVDPDALAAWRGGKWAQDAFPNMKPSERELFISGVCDACFTEMFGPQGLE